MFERIAREMDGAEIQYPIWVASAAQFPGGAVRWMLQSAIVIALAYVMFSNPIVPAPGSGFVVCYSTGRIFTPEECVVYNGPDIKIPADI